MSNSRIDDAIMLMESFVERTGLTAGDSQRRYLWTDAFAVCNFLGLAQVTGEERYKKLALKLVDQVHHNLGRHRGDDPRTGWISGLSESDGEVHPTRGGLRIGKRLPERSTNERFDERLEWDRDGQYFHYLTKWMHALDQVTRSTGQAQFNLWARELLERAQHAFTYQPTAARAHRMYWKMSVDLVRPLVDSMGQHDPLDGYITSVQLHSTAARMPESMDGPSLDEEIGQFAAMIEKGEWTTVDPLGLGGLLIDAYRVEQLMREGVLSDEHLLETLLTAALAGLQHYAKGGEFRLPAAYRLAFRELGLAIGLHAVELMWKAAFRDPGRSSISPRVRARLQALMEYAPIATTIESFWRDPEHQRTQTWFEHRDINDVMLATSLAPEGFLILSLPSEK